MTIRPLSKELQQKALTELNEVPNRTEDDIKQIRDWLEKQPHLNARTEDRWLLNFLRCSKFSIQRTKERLDFFYTMRTLVPEFFADRDPLLPEIQDILNKGLLAPLPRFGDPAGPLILSIRWNKAQPEKNSYLNLIRVALMAADVLLNENDNLSVAGVTILYDLQGYSFNYILQQTPALCWRRNFGNSTTDIATTVTRDILRIVVTAGIGTKIPEDAPCNRGRDIAALTQQKPRNYTLRFYGKGDLSDMYKSVPLSVLPKQYGGSSGCLDEMAVEFKKKVESYRDWFLEDAQYLSDEAKRPTSPKTSADVFGVEGSFRKLDVD